MTQKIVAAACRIAEGQQREVTLGNLQISRDWGWAPEYCEAMYLMLQQERADDFLVATGQSDTLADFVATAFAEVGLDWQQHVRVDAELFRPADIPMSRMNPEKSRLKMGWQAQTQMREVVRRMVRSWQAGQR